MDETNICNLLISVANNTVARINQILRDERTPEENQLYKEATEYLAKVFKTYGRVLGNLPPGPNGEGHSE